MRRPSLARRAASNLAIISVLALVFACAVGIGAYYVIHQLRSDRQAVNALVDAMTAPRVVFDGRTLEARYDLALAEVAAQRGETTEETKKALERFADTGLFGPKRVGYDAFLAQLATRRFEIALGTMRDVANAAKTDPKPVRPAWQLLTLSGVLEFGRGRAVAAEPVLVQAFDLANKRDELDTLPAATLLTALGAVNLSRSQPNEAEPFVRRAASILRKEAGADLRDRARALTHYAQSVAAQGFPEEAEPLCSEALAAAAEYQKKTGRAFADEPAFEATYRKLLRDRGLAEAEIEARVREIR